METTPPECVRRPRIESGVQVPRARRYRRTRAGADRTGSRPHSRTRSAVPRREDHPESHVHKFLRWRGWMAAGRHPQRRSRAGGGDVGSVAEQRDGAVFLRFTHDQLQPIGATPRVGAGADVSGRHREFAQRALRARQAGGVRSRLHRVQFHAAARHDPERQPRPWRRTRKRSRRGGGRLASRTRWVPRFGPDWRDDRLLRCGGLLRDCRWANQRDPGVRRTVEERGGDLLP
jgi:hypothetical protein